MSFNHILNVASVVVPIPSALLAWHDYKARRNARSTTIDVREPVAVMPQPVGTGWAPPATVPGAPPTVSPISDAHSRETVRLGAPLSFPRRLLAGLIDLYGTYLAAILLALAVADPVVDENTYGTAVGLALVIGFIAIAALNANGRSPGKMVVGAELIRFSDRTLRVTFWRSVARFALALIVPFSSWFVLAKSRRALHDRMTDTIVIRTR